LLENLKDIRFKTIIFISMRIPKDFQAFEVETQLIKRYIHPQSEFDLIEVERTDFLPLSGCTQRQVAEMSVSYMNMDNVGRGR